MPKSIPIELAGHKASRSTTLCYLEKIGPLPSGAYITLASLDRDHRYDDGDGERIYYSASGMEMSQLSATNDLGVDNGESKTLTPVYPAQGITRQMVDAGELDGVEFVIYEVNYADPSQGHEIMASGVIGEVRITRGGMVTFENRSWSQFLKQNSVVELDSLTCRVKRFGSQPGEERFPCHYDLTAEWVEGTVSALGDEVVREFFSTELTEEDGYFAPGLVVWIDGNNVGQQNEVDEYWAPYSGIDGAVSLQFTTRFEIEVGDTFQIRRDCTRWWAGHNSCQTFNNRQWFRGEPFIPVSDTTALMVPGAAYGLQTPVPTSTVQA